MSNLIGCRKKDEEYTAEDAEARSYADKEEREKVNNNPLARLEMEEADKKKAEEDVPVRYHYIYPWSI